MASFEELESAIGMMFIGPLIGWRVLVLIHNKRTIRKYEEILGINIREAFPAEGPFTYKSLGYEVVQKLQKFWKGRERGNICRKSARARLAFKKR